ncbi:MAG: LPS biosynthesis RfbU related protein [Planctomycetota bacterium]|nr:MAG: LPS biosynthesis RfbU related protein [Planctomycetota bacterium]
MRILVANDLYGRSSAAGVAVRMAEGLAARGHDVGFLATTQESGGGRLFEQGGVQVELTETPAYPLRWRAWRSLDNPPGNAAMAAAIERFRPDVVHVHNLHIHLGYASLAVARAAGVPTVLHVHDIMPVCHQKMFCHLDERLLPGDPVVYRNGPLKCAVCVRGRYNPLRNRRIRAAIAEHVSELVTVSDEMASALAQNGIGPATTIVNAVGDDAPPPEAPEVLAAAERLRTEHNLHDRQLVFYGGRLDRLKGGLELVTALAAVAEDFPNVCLLTVGEALPGFHQEMLSLAGRLGLRAEQLVHLGWLSGEELAAAYSLADVVTSPSLCFESFGLVNLEAMRAGKPVVASFWGGPSDVVVDGVTGYLVNPMQTATLADRLRRLLTDPARSARMGAAGRRRAAEVFGLEGQLDAVEALYRGAGWLNEPAPQGTHA